MSVSHNRENATAGSQISPWRGLNLSMLTVLLDYKNLTLWGAIMEETSSECKKEMRAERIAICLAEGVSLSDAERICNLYPHLYGTVPA
jgi:hypothetical protein